VVVIDGVVDPPISGQSSIGRGLGIDGGLVRAQRLDPLNPHGP
jgi:hypothetical protein